MINEFEPIENFSRRESVALDLQKKFSMISADLSASQIALTQKSDSETHYCDICYTNPI